MGTSRMMPRSILIIPRIFGLELDTDDLKCCFSIPLEIWLRFEDEFRLDLWAGSDHKL